MRHNKNFNHLGRQAGHRKALLSNMASSLILHKRIETTVAKARALRQFVEPLHTFAVLAILKGMLLETLQKVFGHKSITYVLRIHSLVRRRRGNLFLEVAHLYDQRADQLSQLLIRACFNNCQFHTKILFKILNMRQSNAHPISFPNR